MPQRHHESPSGQSLLAYYQQEHFNPVPIAVETPEAWQQHVERRSNLYQRHLHVPVGWLRGRSVLEFGPNAGENALVLASMGANLTLVEPNDQVIPRMQSLFRQFGLEDRLTAVLNQGVDDFVWEGQYDLILAEGFLYTLPNRDEIVGKMAGWLAPGGIGVISFNDCYGMLLEMVRRAILWRVYQLSGVRDVEQPDALALARRLYADDFAALNATRPFEAWWKDTLVNPLIPRMWSYQDLLSLVRDAGCEFQGSSPAWADVDNLAWYKRVPAADDRHDRLMARWSRVFPYFLTGSPPRGGEATPVGSDVVDAVAGCASAMAVYGADSAVDTLQFPDGLRDFLAGTGDPLYVEFGRDLERIFVALRGSDVDDVIDAYHGSAWVRRLWGAPYHYLSFVKPIEPSIENRVGS